MVQQNLTYTERDDQSILQNTNKETVSQRTLPTCATSANSNLQQNTQETVTQSSPSTYDEWDDPSILHNVLKSTLAKSYKTMNNQLFKQVEQEIEIENNKVLINEVSKYPISYTYHLPMKERSYHLKMIAWEDICNNLNDIIITIFT